MATNAAGADVSTNLQDGAVNAVSWGTFPGVQWDETPGTPPQVCSAVKLLAFQPVVMRSRVKRCNARNAKDLKKRKLACACPAFALMPMHTGVSMWSHTHRPQWGFDHSQFMVQGGSVPCTHARARTGQEVVQASVGDVCGHIFHQEATPKAWSAEADAETREFAYVHMVQGG
eukprot:scaffold91535_cov22-Tisochrysis_lutea.AAC.2